MFLLEALQESFDTPNPKPSGLKLASNPDAPNHYHDQDFTALHCPSRLLFLVEPLQESFDTPYPKPSGLKLASNPDAPNHNHDQDFTALHCPSRLLFLAKLLQASFGTPNPKPSGLKLVSNPMPRTIIMIKISLPFTVHQDCGGLRDCAAHLSVQVRAGPCLLESAEALCHHLQGHCVVEGMSPSPVKTTYQ